VIRVCDKDVLAVIVPHPGYGYGPFLCRKSGVDVEDGHLYIRVPGQTRQARAAEVEMLHTRERRSVAAATLTVALTGEVTHIDREEFFGHLEREIDELGSRLLSTSKAAREESSILVSPTLGRDPRSPEQLEAEVERWRAAAMQARPDVARELFLRILPRSRVTLRNLADRYLTDVLLDVTLPDEVEVTLLSDSAHCLDHGVTPDTLWPAQPAPFGTPPRLAYHPPRASLVNPSSDLTVSESTLSFAVGDLRPRKTVTSNGEFVLIAYEHELPETLTLDWTLYAKGMDAAISGTSTVSVANRAISRR
jgi:hypothetical protein